MLPASTAVLYFATGLAGSGRVRCSSWIRVSGLLLEGAPRRFVARIFQNRNLRCGSRIIYQIGGVGGLLGQLEVNVVLAAVHDLKSNLN